MYIQSLCSQSLIPVSQRRRAHKIDDWVKQMCLSIRFNLKNVISEFCAFRPICYLGLLSLTAHRNPWAACKNRFSFAAWIMVVLLNGTAQFDVVAAQTTDGLEDLALMESLRKGGFYIYFRHAATDWSQNDQVSKAGDWTSCDPGKMRQLSEAGRLYIADKNAHMVKVIGMDYELLGTIGTGKPGKEPGQLNKPEGIAVLGKDVWISDAYNNRIVRYKITE